MLSTVASLFLTPAYGAIADTSSRGTTWAIRVSSLFCALGCFVRGIARGMPDLLCAAFIMGCGIGLWNLVLTSVAANCTDDHRAVVVASFLAQESALRILGKLSYVPFDHVLVHLFGIQDTLIRYRIVMSVCTFFCVFAAVFLFVSAPHPSLAVIAQQGKSDDEIGCRRSNVEEHSKSKLRFALLSSSMFLVNAANQLIIIVWPLFCCR